MEDTDAAPVVDANAEKPSANGGDQFFTTANTIFQTVHRWLDKWELLRFRIFWWAARRIPVRFLSRLNIANLLIMGGLFVFHVALFLLWCLISLIEGSTTGWTFWDFVGRGLGHLIHVDTGIMFFFALRTRLWRIVTGGSVERSLRYHRLLSRFIFFETWIHVIIMFLWLEIPNIRAGSFNFQALIQWNMISGWIGLLCVNLALIFSSALVRRYCYELFRFTHGIWWIGLILGAGFHFVPRSLIVTMIVVAIFFVLDWIFRLWSIFGCPTRVVDAAVTADGKVMKLVLNKKRFQFRAGQYVFLCIPRLSPLEWHPFSIMSPEDEIPNYDLRSSCTFEIHAKLLGNWTRRLQKLITKRSAAGITSSMFTVFVEGPYGHPQIPLLLKKDFSAVVLVAAGIGLVPMMSFLRSYFLARKGFDENATKKVILVWSTRSKAEIRENEPLFKEIIEADSSCLMQFELHIHLTHGTPKDKKSLVAPTTTDLKEHEQSTDALNPPSSNEIPPSSASSLELQDNAQNGTEPISQPPQSAQEVQPSADAAIPVAEEEDPVNLSIPFQSGRPKYAELFAQIRQDHPNRVAVAVCAPRRMCMELSLICARNKFDYHEENFGW